MKETMGGPFFPLLLNGYFLCTSKSLQSRPTLCDAIPGILRARTLEWVAISFSNTKKWKWSHSVMSDSLRPHGLQPTRLLRPWDFPGKSTGVGCHCLLHFRRKWPANRRQLVQMRKEWDFPGGSVVKNRPSSAGHMGFIPGPGRFYMTWGNWDLSAQLLSHPSRVRALKQETPPYREAHTPQQKEAPTSHN